MTRRRPRRTEPLAALAIALGLGACAADPRSGYSLTPSFERGITSVAVTPFDNQTFHTSLTADLATALTRRLQRDTPWRVTASGRAQTVIRGTIREVQIGRLTRDDAGGITQQASVRVLVDFTWTEAVGRRALVERRGLAVAESFTPAAGEPIEVGLSAAADEMASAIVAELRGSW